jgi:putative ABC transport system permease protein
MNLLRELARRFKMLMHRRQFDTDLEEEMRLHLELRQQQRIEYGMTPDDARTAARRGFGNVTLLREKSHMAWGWEWFEQLVQDMRYGLRMLRKSSGFTAVAVLTLALGIGANTYIFSVVDALVFRPMAFPDPARLVALWERVPSAGLNRNELAPANFLDWQQQNHVFDHIAAYSWWNANLGGVERPEHLHGIQVTPDFFTTLEAQPVLGRAFLPEEGTPGKDLVAVLSCDLWRDHFAADPSIVGKPVLLNGIKYTVVGVMGPDFNYPSGAQVWSPLTFPPDVQANRGGHYLLAVAHLAAGVPREEAQAEMSTIASQLVQQYPQTNTGRGINVMPLMESEVGEARTLLAIMLSAVGLVLLIACANISNLMLARAGHRQRETAIRVALGATRLRLIRLLLVESTLLGLLGGSLGSLFAFLFLKFPLFQIPSDFARLIPGWGKIAINTPVLLFTLVVSVGTGLIFGLLPALGASQPNVSDTLKEGAPSASMGRGRLRNVLIVAEVAVSLALLATAGLMMKSFLHLEQVSPGFNPDRVLTMFIALPSAKYNSDQQVATFYEQLLDRVQNLPGVQSTAVANILPMSKMNTISNIRIDGRPEPKPGEEPGANVRAVSNSYFQTMQIPIDRGREFTSQDSAKGQQVVAVNETFAARFWPGEDPIGKRVRLSGPLNTEQWRTVVAVVGNIRNQVEVPPPAEIYFPLRQQTRPTMVLVVRTATDPRSLAESVRTQVTALDRDLPVFDVMTMQDWRSISVLPQKIGGSLMAAFAGFALLLSAIGLFGVIAYSVSERTHEIGIRMALGAGRGKIFRLVVGQGMLIALVGLLLGLPLALGMGRAVGGLLYGVAPNDFTTFAAVAAIFSTVALAACYIPARRAMGVDPMVALRHEGSRRSNPRSLQRHLRQQRLNSSCPHTWHRN